MDPLGVTALSSVQKPNASVQGIVDTMVHVAPLIVIVTLVMVVNGLELKIIVVHKL